MSASRRKGTSAESAVVAWLREHGWPHAERRALAGAKDRGDITGMVGFVGEVKSAARLELASWMDELAAEVANDHAAHGLLIVRRKGRPDPGGWYAITRLDDWARLAREAGWAPTTEPRIVMELP